MLFTRLLCQSCSSSFPPIFLTVHLAPTFRTLGTLSKGLSWAPVSLFTSGASRRVLRRPPPFHRLSAHDFKPRPSIPSPSMTYHLPFRYLHLTILIRPQTQDIQNGINLFSPTLSFSFSLPYLTANGTTIYRIIQTGLLRIIFFKTLLPLDIQCVRVCVHARTHACTRSQSYFPIRLSLLFLSDDCNGYHTGICISRPNFFMHFILLPITRSSIKGALV